MDLAKALRTGLKAKVYVPYEPGAAIEGEDIWIRVTSIDNDDGTFVGVIESEPSGPLAKGDDYAACLSEVKEVAP
jgi:hypothetical protein